jgi:hypothetical protein
VNARFGEDEWQPHNSVIGLVRGPEYRHAAILELTEVIGAC